jgi:hypothetical protein
MTFSIRTPFIQVQKHDDGLAGSVQSEYIRLEPFLRDAVKVSHHPPIRINTSYLSRCCRTHTLSFSSPPPLSCTQLFVKNLDPEYAKDPENEDKHFFVAFFNMSDVEKVRSFC